MTTLNKTITLKAEKEKGYFKMAIKKNKHSVAVVLNEKGNVVGYLSAQDESQGLDIQLNMQGYTIIAL